VFFELSIIVELSIWINSIKMFAFQVNFYVPAGLKSPLRIRKINSEISENSSTFKVSQQKHSVELRVIIAKSKKNFSRL